MHKKYSPSGFFLIFTILLSLLFVSCQDLFGSLTQNQTKITQIKYSGLTEDKYVSGKIGSYDATINLVAKTATFHAEVDVVTPTSSSARTVQGYDGYFVYNKNEKDLYLFFTSDSIFKKAKVDLTGDNGSDSTNRAVCENDFTAVDITTFNSAVNAVAAISSDTGDDTTPGGNTETDPLPLSTEKTLSDYVDGVRELNFGERDNRYDALFVSTIQPRPRPDYSEIDNMVRNLDIPTTETIANAAKTIIATLPETATVKEKTRAIFAWVALHIDYDNGYATASYTKEGAFTNRIAVCSGYAALITEMCNSVGIVCETRDGNVASGSGRYKIGNLAHAWNIVYEDTARNNGFILDVTWASEGTMDTRKYIEEQWFDPDPCYFVTTHWAEKEASLTGREISRDEFYTLPVLYPKWEQYGIDGKELLEFCWKHKISSVVSFDSLTQGTNVLYMPVGMVDIGKQYSFAFEHNGTPVSGKFYPSPSGSQSGHCFVDFKEAGSMSYVLSDSVEEEVIDYSQPKWIIYDDEIEFEPLSNPAKLGIDLDNGWWASYEFNTTQPPSVNFYDTQESGLRNYDHLVATWDAVYQQWSYARGRKVLGTYDAGLTAEEKAEQDEKLVHALEQVIVKIDPSIPLNRFGNYRLVEFNVVYVPLSKEEEVKDSVLNYDWNKDDEFREFVYWMEDYGIPTSQIDFYKAMARYPLNRGSIVSEGYFENGKWITTDKRYAGLDMNTFPWNPPLYEEDGETMYFAGGMQLYFEYRKHETRHLFNNKKIPVLILSIRDSDTETHREHSATYFTDFGDNLKEKLCAYGLEREYEIDYEEISLSYKDYGDTYFPEDNPGVGDGEWIAMGDWMRISIGKEEIFEKLREKNPALAEKYSDETKTAVLKIFSDEEENLINYHSLTYKNGLECSVGNTNVPFWILLNALGYHRDDHDQLFGSLLKYESPACYAMNCVRDDAICPLCLYSFDIHLED